MTQGIDVLLKEQRVFPPPKEISEKAYIKSMAEYEAMYKRSIEDPEGFWAEIAEQNITWYKKWDKVLDYDFNKPYIKWFINGKLNASYNCLDRNLNSLGNKAALIWEADDGEVKTYTYWQLYREVNRFANVLKKLGIKKGDRVSIYLPMIPELPITLLACARIGAIHSVVFAGFSAQSLRDRINDCGAKLLITANQGIRGGRIVPLKANADQALEGAPSVEKVIVVKRTPNFVDMDPQRDFWWHDLMNDPEIANYCEPEVMDAEDPLFILYTSGSTGKPKGVLHTTGGYMVYTNITFKWVFDYKPEETFFCTADIGWVTGHSYIVYGPLSAGATSLMFEGVPTYPNPGRFWEIVEKHRVNIFYTAPTAIRALMREGEKWPYKYDLSSLRILGTVGEPINPEAWIWYYKHVGRERCPIVDTWWQTETGGFMITPLPGAMTLKPGSATRPFFGVVPRVLKEDGSPAGVNEGGYLVIEKPWPGILRGTWGDPENKRIKEVYFSRFPGKYFTGDGARVDEDGDYWLMGRIDDVINVSGHRIGTAEVESALVAHPAVAEAAVVGFPHDIKGEGIYVYVVLKEGYEPSKDLEKLLISHIRQMIGPIATPDKIQFAGGLPKTRSGKIMRRILRKIASGAIEELGDTSTLADPSVVEELIAGKK
ncbi:MAG: acetate--CoA ligase [Thermodesulfovibrio sp.]|uniref:acetate--CoA ligase n=1 Tax=unclassified Thermodesulfovibrio TaxID=2645936 RepID=UPI00083A5739|nr:MULTISPECIES: acetate--CoA ligase [unclassified Thermodesulfovibrio]MDI1471487.1 acetate--CoA ligase [Thermodesulfovibrio sp. 1176]MDI6715061.1 acetate--CoA ligase [Thermodesulfovibrio sp.]ODA43680.1 Acetyl-coenzyme A synthetase [Thermodesulfovibrio sp. N1]